METFDGKDFAGDFETVDPGAYFATLKSAEIYLSNLYQSDDTRLEMTLVWETDETGSDGQKLSIFDSFIGFTLNEKSKLVSRLKPLVNGAGDPRDWKLGISTENGVKLKDVPHRDKERTKVDQFQINGETLFGRGAIVTVEKNDKGYAKVTNVSAPPKGKPAGAPA